jgi:DNA-binding protein H-NS
MLDVVSISEELFTKLRHETDLLMSDRLMTRDVLAARIQELGQKRDEELSRVDQWASQQKTLINEIFSALISETEADRLRNEQNLAKMKGEAPPPAKPAPAGAKHLKAAE